MAKERIEKMLIILDGAEVEQVCRLARGKDAAEILQFVTQVIARKVEAALRQRCK